MCRLIGLAVFTFCLTAILVPVQLAARDDGRFANSPLKPWFDRLASGKGLWTTIVHSTFVALIFVVVTRIVLSLRGKLR